MNAKDRVNAMFHKKNFDRMALMGNPWEDTYVKWVQQGYPTHMVFKNVGDSRWNPQDGRSVKVTEAGEYIEPVPIWKHFNYDMALVSGFWDYHPHIDHHKVIEETDEWEIYENGSGAHLKYWKHRMGTPEHIAFHMTTREIWEDQYRPLLLDFNPARIDIAQGRKVYAETGEGHLWRYFGHQHVFESMRSALGDVTLYENLLLDPEWIHDYCRVYTDFFLKGFQYQFDNIGLPDGVWLYEDLGYKNGLFASPHTYQKMIFPYYKEMIDFFHTYDLPVVLHSCGSVAQAMELIIEVGFDALNPIERKANHNDPFAFAEKYGKHLVFIGGMDVRVLETNDKDTIQKETKNLLDGMKSRGARLVFTEDHSIPPTVDLDSYQWMLDAFWKNCHL